MRNSEIGRVIAELRWELACINQAIASLQRFSRVNENATRGNRQHSHPRNARQSKAGAALLAKLIANQRAAESPAAR